MSKLGKYYLPPSYQMKDFMQNQHFERGKGGIHQMWWMPPSKPLFWAAGRFLNLHNYVYIIFRHNLQKFVILLIFLEFSTNLLYIKLT